MLKRFLPTHDSIKNSRLLSWLGPRLHDPSLWHVNRRAVAKGVAIGAFFGLMIPVAQIPAAAVFSLLMRANLWIAAVSTLVSNPFTYAPLYYFAYRLGATLLGAPVASSEAVEAQAGVAGSGLAEIWEWIMGVGQPLMLGMLVMAVTGAVVGYVAARIFWRLRVVLKRKRRAEGRALRHVVPAAAPAPSQAR